MYFKTLKEAVNGSKNFEVISRVAYTHEGQTNFNIKVKKARSKKNSYVVEYANGMFSEEVVY